MPTAVSWIMVDHTTGADPCDSHGKASSSTLDELEEQRAPPFLDPTARHAWV
jgi:hypothetical protein